MNKAEQLLSLFSRTVNVGGGFMFGWVVCNLYWHVVVIQIMGRQKFNIDNAKKSQEVISGVKHGLFTKETEQKIKDTNELGEKLRELYKKVK